MNVNTIYIMSKGRPQCKTAQTLEAIGYPGEWFIVCGDNDETLSEYLETWGSRVLVFDWREYAEKADLMDNLGLDEIPSGATPARNAIKDISASRGEDRHWQFDDDFSYFMLADKSVAGYTRIEDGEVLERAIRAIAEFGFKAKLANVGFGSCTFQRWKTHRAYQRHVFCAHNLPSDDSFITWRSRIGDDVINVIDAMKYGGVEISFDFIGYAFAEIGKYSGGNTTLYSSFEGFKARSGGYKLLTAPKATRLYYNDRKKEYITRTNYSGMTQKIIRDVRGEDESR